VIGDDGKWGILDVDGLGSTFCFFFDGSGSSSSCLAADKPSSIALLAASLKIPFFFSGVVSPAPAPAAVAVVEEVAAATPVGLK